ncbi:hypothetical protein HHK36_019911 [Tetracentron sinense]|uniref:Uncharacterized protein n=1 Tax=Tetracentron sinense TaxID=13715 RepID=A0A834YW76_TETSI|nr:hypothetical protein HHK36_019911 [Tetracentron sinense]
MEKCFIENGHITHGHFSHGEKLTALRKTAPKSTLPKLTAISEIWAATSVIQPFSLEQMLYTAYMPLSGKRGFDIDLNLRLGLPSEVEESENPTENRGFSACSDVGEADYQAASSLQQLFEATTTYSEVKDFARRLNSSSSELQTNNYTILQCRVFNFIMDFPPIDEADISHCIKHQRIFSLIFLTETQRKQSIIGLNPVIQGQLISPFEPSHRKQALKFIISKQNISYSSSFDILKPSLPFGIYATPGEEFKDSIGPITARSITSNFAHVAIPDTEPLATDASGHRDTDASSSQSPPHIMLDFLTAILT